MCFPIMWKTSNQDAFKREFQTMSYIDNSIEEKRTYTLDSYRQFHIYIYIYKNI